MYIKSDNDFYNYWLANRILYKKSIRPFLVGLSVGFAIGTGILLVIYLGWYERANMQANTSFSPILFLLAIVSTAIFMAYFYRHYQWEQKEQRYLSILARMKQKEINTADAALEV